MNDRMVDWRKISCEVRLAAQIIPKLRRSRSCQHAGDSDSESEVELELLSGIGSASGGDTKLALRCSTPDSVKVVLARRLHSLLSTTTSI